MPDDSATLPAAVAEADALDGLVRWVVDVAWPRMPDGSTVPIKDIKQKHKEYLPHIAALPHMMGLALRKLNVPHVLKDINHKLRK
jgi:hypothetical protein